MAKENNKKLSKIVLILIGVWIVSLFFDGLPIFTVLLQTHQIKYIGIIHTPKLPLVYGLGFELEPYSPLKLAFSGLTLGIFVALNAQTVKSKPDILVHELRHVQQRLYGGPFKVIALVGWYEYQVLIHHSYWEAYLSNPFERDAYRFAEEADWYNRLITNHAPQLSRLKL